MVNAVVGLASSLQTACAGIQNSINPAGPQAERISHLWWLMFYVCSAVFVIVMAFTFVAIRNRSNPRKEFDPEEPVLHPAAQGESQRYKGILVATGLTCLILIVFLIDSFFVGRSLTAELSQKNGVAIEITGHQWWWEARYLDSNASNIFTTANEIHIPVGVPVTFTLHANDVIHSFWVPNLTGKKDLIPGKVATIWLQADRAGVYRGQCAEYCGLQHAHMAFWIIAESQTDFNSWRQNQTQSSVLAATESQRRGQQVFLSATCVMCHAINGTPAGSNVGPNLTHLASRRMIAAASLTNTKEHLQQWVVNSQAIKPGNKMPQNTLAPDDLQALTVYLQSLK